MGGNDTHLERHTFSGYNGRYRVREQLGRGGNGVVYVAESLENEQNQYALKLLSVNNYSKNEQKKRKVRFRNEIKTTITLFERNIDGIMPILDYSKTDSRLWYLMPKAEKYLYSKYTYEERIAHLIRIACTIKDIHFLGYAHRDIKPGNLLILNNEIILTDFGLVHNIDRDYNITAQGEFVGPAAIRPPELWNIGLLRDRDYRPSDVYLFAKTAWIVLTENRHGFQGQYNRSNENHSLNRWMKDENIWEPLHRLLGEATCDDMGKRISIDGCIELLMQQKAILNHAMPLTELNELKHEEQVAFLFAENRFDEIKYTNLKSIVDILNRFIGSTVSFVEYGVREKSLKLKSATMIENDTIELRLIDVYRPACVKQICVDAKEITIKRDSSVTLHINGNSKRQSICMFSSITQAIISEMQRVFLNGNYEIVIEI